MRFLLYFLTFMLFTAAEAKTAPPSTTTKVELFAPQGSVKGVRQVQARFSDAMVRFGDPRLADPFSRRCPASGSGRWVDERSWVFDFAADLPAGLRCEFLLQPGLRDLAGHPVGDPGPYLFDTGGPSILGSLPSEGASGIDEAQAFVLRLDAPPDPESVRRAAHCEVEGIAERIEVEPLLGDARAALLSAQFRQDNDWFFDEAGGEDRLLALRCRRNFPPDTEVRLVWGAGIASAAGIVTDNDQVLSFKTRPAFTASFQCERVNANAQCVPLLPMTLRFSAPIPADKAWTIHLAGTQGKDYPADPVDSSKTPVVDRITFKGPFPEKERFTIVIPEGLTDDAGRPLENASSFPLAVETDELPPLAKFSGEFGILELKEGGVLPVTLRNLEAPVAGKQAPASGPAIPGKLRRQDQDDQDIMRWMKKVAEAGKTRMESETLPNGDLRWRNLTGSESVFAAGDPAQTIEVPKSGGGKEFEVVGIPLKDPGFYVVELASPKLGTALLRETRPRYVATSALVTNMAVHLKWGRESSLIWVSTLDQAHPVAQAEIRISDFCSGAELWRGQTDADGLARIEGGKLPAPNGSQESADWNDAHPLFVSARKAGDLGFTVSAWNKGLQPGDFKLSEGSAYQAKVAHTVFDRTLFRAGETVSMKHYARQRTGSGFTLPAEALPDRLEVRHSGSGDKYELPLAFDARGIAESSWAIPREAKLGTYEVSWYRGENWWGDGGGFRVEQFRVPSMKGVIQPSQPFLVNAREATLDLFVSYLSGGGASGAPVKLRTQTEPRTLSFKSYEDFAFGGAEVHEGFQEERDDSGRSPVQTVALTLDKAGAARHTVKDLPVPDGARELLAELEFQDASGERMTVAQRIPLWPASINLGIKPDGWVANAEQLRFQVVALDLSGQPLQAQAVQVELFQKTTYSYRKRLIGGFYAYEDKTEIKRLPQSCRGNTDTHGIVACDIKPGISGEVVLRAATRDAQGNTAIATQDVWVAGGDEWWFSGGPSDRMDLLPEQKAYEPGAEAQFQVRMPFREATALVTVEREGVLDAFVTRLSGKQPVLRLPIKDQYAPNVYVSVLALRGRAEEHLGWFRALAERLGLAERRVSETALVDLNKPAYRLGLAGIDVGWSPYRLDVQVHPDREVYKVRDKAKVRLSVKPANGQPLPPEAEVAVAAVDEGLLELKPNESWRLLEHMMGQRGIEVHTATAQMQVVGKRHYGRKAIPHGGGGGHQAARELFDTLLLWRGRLPLDAKGEAELEVPLNDSLSSFRLAAVASAGLDHFGRGEASIRSTQDLMLHAGLPPVVREGDRFKAIFTLRNASQRKLALKVGAHVAGLEAAPAASQAPASGNAAPGRELPPLQLELEAGQARDLAWDIDVPAEARRLEWDVSAEASDGSARDRMKSSQEVIAPVPARVFQATLQQVDKPVDLPVARPQDAVPGRGDVRVSLRARLGDGLGGVVEYMTRYPYTCLEQRVSRAVALGDDGLWSGIQRELPAYIDRDGLFRYFASDKLQGSDVLTAYVLAIAKASGRELPSELQRQALDGLRSFVGGQLLRPSALPVADLVLRKLAAVRTLALYGEAKAEMLASLNLDPKNWPTSALLDWIEILQHLPALPQSAARLQEAQQLLRSRLNLQGTTLGFSSEASDALWWLMVSADENAVRAILTLLDLPSWQEDLPRLVTGAIGRQQAGHWLTTPANAWGTVALDQFSRRFEAQEVTGYTEASLGEARKGMEWSETAHHSALNLPWPETGAGELKLTHNGAGKPWALIQSRAAIPLKQPLFTGYRIQRSVTGVEQAQPGVWSRGDVARVRLELDAQTDMTWVVVDDPIPAGASILGSGLGGDSRLLTAGERQEGWVSPVFQERRFDALRAYYDFVPKGKWTLEYTVRFNNPGRFELPPTRVEALYAPEMFGELPNAALEIGDAP